MCGTHHKMGLGSIPISYCLLWCSTKSYHQIWRGSCKNDENYDDYDVEYDVN